MLILGSCGKAPSPLAVQTQKDPLKPEFIEEKVKLQSLDEAQDSRFFCENPKSRFAFNSFRSQAKSNAIGTSLSFTYKKNVSSILSGVDFNPTLNFLGQPQAQRFPQQSSQYFILFSGEYFNNNSQRGIFLSSFDLLSRKTQLYPVSSDERSNLLPLLNKTYNKQVRTKNYSVFNNSTLIIPKNKSYAINEIVFNQDSGIVVKELQKMPFAISPQNHINPRLVAANQNLIAFDKLQLNDAGQVVVHPAIVEKQSDGTWATMDTGFSAFQKEGYSFFSLTAFTPSLLWISIEEQLESKERRLVYKNKKNDFLTNLAIELSAEERLVPEVFVLGSQQFAVAVEKLNKDSTQGFLLIYNIDEKTLKPSLSSRIAYPTEMLHSLRKHSTQPITTSRLINSIFSINGSTMAIAFGEPFNRLIQLQLTEAGWSWKNFISQSECVNPTFVQ